MGCGNSSSTQERDNKAPEYKILLVNSSGRSLEESKTRKRAAKVVEDLQKEQANGASVTTRDLGNQKESLPHVDAAMVDSFFAQGERTAEQKAAVTLSDELVAEVQAADCLVIGAPLYNFGAPAALKAWADLIARAGVTFKYTAEGPVGLLNDKKVYFVLGSGGAPIGSEMDVLTPWLKCFFTFLGITDQTVVDANEAPAGAEEKA